jgi:serine phosphatase RsbU (regulator of sigma subunit)
MTFEQSGEGIISVIKDVSDATKMLMGELNNFHDIAHYIKPSPGELPRLNGVDIYGDSIPLNGIMGGDHIIYVDFDHRYDINARIEKARDRKLEHLIPELEACRHKTGIVMADVSGHQITDALLAAMLHQAFLLGAMYEMDQYGNITEKLFENLNTRFYNSSSVSKFLTMIYGEISEDGRFEFLSAGHPMPFVYSYKNERLVDFPEDKMISFPPIGTLPSQRDIDRRTQKSVLGFKEDYEVNKWNLMGDGDILIIYTDGLIEHECGEELYAPNLLEKKLTEVKDRSSKEIFHAIKDDLLAFAQPEDDISFAVIKWH